MPRRKKAWRRVAHESRRTGYQEAKAVQEALVTSRPRLMPYPQTPCCQEEARALLNTAFEITHWCCGCGKVYPAAELD